MMKRPDQNQHHDESDPDCLGHHSMQEFHPTMRCDRVQFYYDEYSRGNLPVATLSRIEEHLAGCPACREYFEQNDLIAHLMRESSDVAHPGLRYFDQLAARVMEQVDVTAIASEAEPLPGELIPLAPWRRPLWWVGGMAAAALLALGIVPEIHRKLMTESAQQVALANGVATTLQPAPSPESVKMFKTVIEQGRQRQLAMPLALKGTPVNITTLDKSHVGRGSNPWAVEDIIGTSGQQPGDYSNNAPLGEADRRSTEEAEKRLASIQRQVERQEKPPKEILEQIQLIKTQMISLGNGELTENLRQLDRTVQMKIGENASLSDMPIIQQARYYLKAEDALKGGRPHDAWMHYRQVIKLDETSPLTVRAHLQMADLNYSEFGDFTKAVEHYKNCQGPRGSEALTSTEREHVTRQMDRLVRYSDNNWEALRLLHEIRHERWDHAGSALLRLTELPDTDSLYPEAARGIVDRMAVSPPDNPAITNEIYNLLEKQAKIEQKDEVRSWLALALGDIALMQFKNSRQAIVYYRQVVQLAGDSGAAKSARLKLYDLEERNLSDLVRN